MAAAGRQSRGPIRTSAAAAVKVPAWEPNKYSDIYPGEIFGSAGGTVGVKHGRGCREATRTTNVDCAGKDKGLFPAR